jgi:hypothetical protein
VIEDAHFTGSGATATPVLNGTGGIASITLTNSGSNYSAPVIYIVDLTGPGTGADALAVIGPPFTGGLRKFVTGWPARPDRPNEIGQYIPCRPDSTTHPGSLLRDRAGAAL